ncbi:MAG TPA: sialidase family protein, partial [Polyangiaceae bacterium]|nr:sialidase family protein [Polyangiaceae bacterium]
MTRFAIPEVVGFARRGRTKSRAGVCSLVALALTAGCASGHDGAAPSAGASGGNAGQLASAGTSSSGASGQGGGGGTGAGGSMNGGAGTSHGGASAGAANEGGAPPADDCVLEAGCEAGTWVDVTPASVSLTEGECGNFGTKSVQVDAAHPERLYTWFFCQGIYQSNDYGQTWTGPVNTGANAAVIADCAGLIALPPHDTSPSPPMYVACIRGAGLGFWRSTNAGVDWTRFSVTPESDKSGQQFYPPAIDPYDDQHLLMAGHGVDVLVESVDGGENWSEVAIEPGMSENGGTMGINFIDTG